MVSKTGDRNSARRELLWFASVATTIKLLLIPAYHSTDFEVHRHWLAITASLPLKHWYLDQTSEWTLDYPPLFAWFEHGLSYIARFVDPVIVDLHHGLNYKGQSVIIFQRLSVIFSDFLLYYGLWRCCRNLAPNQQRLIYLAVIFSPGLFIVDHIHFQYNGFLIGILMLSLSFLRDGDDFLGGILFAVLLCFKHLFAVAAPVYFVYLLRHYCMDLKRFFLLGGSVIAVVLASFGPFLYYGQMGQVLGRLFPFGRGLCHAYWAPNFWALYNIADKVLAHLFKKLGFNIDLHTASMTGGLVGDSKTHAVLPQITPSVTLVIVILAMLPCLVKLWRRAQKEYVLFSVTYAYYCGYMFGWHVHEKACLHFVIPLSILSITSVKNARGFLFLSTVSNYSLFPLLYQPNEYPIKVVLLVLHTLVMSLALMSHFSSAHPKACVFDKGLKGEDSELFGKKEIFYVFGLLVLEVYTQFFHSLIFHERLPFLPLMITSVYCALGILYVWIRQFLCMCNFTIS